MTKQQAHYNKINNNMESEFPTQMQHTRLAGWRYDCKCNYMITLVTEPRSSIFGELEEWGVARSEAGKVVFEVWQEIEGEFPGVRASYNSIMPDHFHGIIYISFDGAADLAKVVEYFASEVERRIGRRIWAALWWDSICIARGQLDRQIKYVLSNAKRRWIKEHNPGMFSKRMGFRHWRLESATGALAEVEDADNWDFLAFKAEVGDEVREYWEVESGEEIEKPRKANCRQLAFTERQQAHDNKETAASGKKIFWNAVGNPFLLDEPMLISVRVSRQISAAELSRVVEKVLAKAERGAVIVGPWVSPGEKAVKEAVAEAGGKIVELLSEPMGRYYKPAGRDFDLCADGRMLVLSPFAPREKGLADREHYGKARFEWLNLAARAMADFAIGWAPAAR